MNIDKDYLQTTFYEYELQCWKDVYHTEELNSTEVFTVMETLKLLSCDRELYNKLADDPLFGSREILCDQLHTMFTISPLDHNQDHEHKLFQYIREKYPEKFNEELGISVSGDFLVKSLENFLKLRVVLGPRDDWRWSKTYEGYLYSHRKPKGFYMKVKAHILEGWMCVAASYPIRGGLISISTLIKDY